MIGFFIKKSFFDGWDNLVQIFIQNLIYIVIFIATLFALYFTLSTETPFLAGVVLLLVLQLSTCILLGGTAATVLNYSDYKRETWGPFAAGVKRNFKHSLLFFALTVLLEFMAFSIWYYLNLGNTAAMFIAVLIFWVAIIVLMALPYYYPLMNLLPGDGPLKTFKKCFIILSDNAGFSLFYLLYNTVVVVFSLFIFGLVPGVVGYMLGAEDAVKLLMLKYDYLEENPPKNPKERKKIPWAEILYDEKEKVGPRSLKSMLFPWKY